MKTTAAIDLILGLMERALRVSDAIRQARSEGRDDLTDEEVDLIKAEDDAARADFQKFIDSI